MKTLNLGNPPWGVRRPTAPLPLAPLVNTEHQARVVLAEALASECIAVLDPALVEQARTAYSVSQEADAAVSAARVELRDLEALEAAADEVDPAILAQRIERRAVLERLIPALTLQAQRLGDTALAAIEGVREGLRHSAALAREREEVRVLRVQLAEIEEQIAERRDVVDMAQTALGRWLPDF